EAITDADIDAITVGGAGAGGFALGGSVTKDDVANLADAHISGGADVQATGFVKVAASDNSSIDGFAGGFAGAAGAGIGAGITTDTMESQVLASIDGAQVAAPDVVVSATLDASMDTLAMGGAGADGFA